MERRLPGTEERWVATCYRSDVGRIGQEDKCAYPGNPDSESIAITPVAGVDEVDGIQPDQSGLYQCRQRRARG